ncbi:hypothetical protein MB02_03395 [Croceicoccus estronivorus]|uniref:copper chaperone PCu(A)C n=1 Tax=Croceicoccus estronivorus TaxID=1172626 RepID=UPI0008350567|nr:copper chaperone PCu(A)C [Croceicoccus estronivorus]OCC24548.1 hypothetical protein MB02_03395 [Croceicoccus estronivorus]
MKSTIFASVALALAGVSLTACGQEQAPPAATEGKPGVEITNGRLVLPAVADNPGVLYFDISYNGDDYAVLRKVEVASAKEATMHETITTNGVTQMGPIPPLNLVKGEEVKFEPGGKHVMVMGLDPALKAGDKTEVTLTFTGGDKLSFDATVEAPGGGN